MKPEWGPVGAATVVRTWAERFVEVLRPRAGERLQDFTRDGGMLRQRLERAVAPGGHVSRVFERSLFPSGLEETCTPLYARQIYGELPAVPAIVVAPDRGGATLFALIQLGGDASPHEAAVTAILGDAAHPATLTEAEVASLAAGPPAMRVERLRDVLRFDGLDQLWIALVTERGIDAPLDPSRRALLETLLTPWIAPDGTLRIAVEAACFEGSVLKLS